MKISIITPVYNAAATVETTILSVINQPIRSELEYIIVDGGSTDGTQEVIQRHIDQISLFLSEKDHGVYDAMNKGIAQASGDIIGIINADDWYNSDALKTVEETFREQPSIDVLYSSIDNYFKGKYFNTFAPGDIENIYIKFVLNHPSCFVRKHVYDSLGGYDLQYKIAADYDFMLHCYVAGYRFQYTEKVLASYSLDGMSGLEAPFSIKLRQLQESQKISTAYILQSGKDYLLEKQRKFYSRSKLKLLMTFPFKRMGIITPNRTNFAKQYLRKYLGGLQADRYGSW